MRKLITVFLAAFVLLASNSQATGLVIEKDTLWSGEVKLSADVLVLAGVTLTIAPGTQIIIQPSDSTRTEPEYISSYSEITVRGVLRAAGTKEKPIIFKRLADDDDNWAGIIVDEGDVSLSWCRISGAESGLSIIKGRADVSNCRFTENRYGISVLSRGNAVGIVHSDFANNDYGLVLMNGAKVTRSDNKFIASKQRDLLETTDLNYHPDKLAYKTEEKKAEAPYQSESLLGTVVWSGRITVNGVIRIPGKSRLIIMPGTIVEFTKNDTNGDGIGENGLLVMGMLIAKGTADAPIIFRSAEKSPKPADWDAINIYTSDGFQNLLEYVQVEDAYRAVHIHFSNVLLNHAVLQGNYRGLQFQESVVEVKNSQIYDNKSSVRARDSELHFTNNQVYNNYAGPNIFRMTGDVTGNIFANNYYDGLRVREGALQVSGNAMLGNRFGLTVAYANYGAFGGNVFMGNQDDGVVLKGTDNIKVAGNFIQSNSGNGISLLDSRAEVSGNDISYNGERGIGIISFSGVISRNNLFKNHLYALGLSGDNDINATNNWWGDKPDMAAIIYDKSDDSKLGKVDYKPLLADSVPFVWPLPTVPVDTIWHGDIRLTRTVETRAGSSLTVNPGTAVKFSKAVSLWLFGKIEARGLPEKRIKFTADVESDGEYWDQITTEKSVAVFDNCDFSNGNMALHSHFSNVDVLNCRFERNDSGFRARGGPVSVKNSLFSKNVYGMVFYLAKGVVEENIFTNNEMGILVRAERRGGMIVRHNNIYDNTRYNIRMGDFNEGNSVNAKNNWWGGNAPGDMIWDDFDEPGIGLVEYEPFADSAFQLKIKN